MVVALSKEYSPPTPPENESPSLIPEYLRAPNFVEKATINLGSVQNLAKTPEPTLQEEPDIRLRRADSAIAFLSEVQDSPERKLAQAHLNFLQEVLVTLRQFPIELRSDYPLKGDIYPAWNDRGVIPKEEYCRLIGEKVDWFLNNRVTVQTKILTQGSVDSLATMVGGDLAAELKRLGLDHMPKTEDELYALYNKFVEKLRDADLYDVAESVIDVSLHDEFDPHVSYLHELILSHRYADDDWRSSKDEANSFVEDNEKQWRKKGMSSEQIENSRQQLVSSFFMQKLRHTVAKKYKAEIEKSLHGEKGRLFAQYTKMLDTDDEYFSISDESGSRFKDVLAHNLPFVALGVGAGVVVRKVVISLAERYFLNSGVTAIADFSASVAGRALATTSLFVVDQSVGSMVYRGLTDQWYSGSSDYVRDLLMGLFARGVLVAGEAGLKATVMVGAKSVQVLKLSTSATAKSVADTITKIIPSITDPALRDLVRKLLADNNVVAAATVVYGSFRKGLLKAIDAVNTSYIKGQIADFVADTADSLRIDGQLNRGAQQAM